MAYQPKSYKKFVATAATATLVATAIVPVASAADAKSFKDVSKTYQEAVNYLVTNDIAQGKSDTMFGTSATITRGDAAVMIAKALKLDTTKAPSAGFKDVNARVGGAVNALVAAKIVSGKTATTFAPDSNISRQEMAKIIANAYKLDAGTTKNKFNDVNKNWDGFVDALVANGITFGKNETTFAPTASVTRGEFALFVFRTENLTPPPVVVDPSNVSVVSVSAITLTDVTVTIDTPAVDLADAKVIVRDAAGKVVPTKLASVKAGAQEATFSFVNPITVSPTSKWTVNGVAYAPAKLEIVEVDSVTPNGKYLEVLFNKSLTSLEASEISIRNSNTLVRVGVESVKLASDGMSAQVTLLGSEDAASIIQRLTSYDFTLTQKGTVTSKQFTLPGYITERSVTAVDAKERTITVNGTTLKVPTTMAVDFELALGQEVAVWFDKNNNVTKFNIVEQTVKYDAVKFEVRNGVTYAKLATEGKEYRLANNANLWVKSATGVTDTGIANNATYASAKLVFNNQGQVQNIVAVSSFNPALLVESVTGDIVKANTTEYNLKDYTVVKDGKTIALSELKAGDVLYYNQTLKFAEVYSKSVKGKIEAVYQGQFKLGGKVYDNAGHFVTADDYDGLDADALEAFKAADKEVTIYFDRAGNIQLVSGVVAEVVSNTSISYNLKDGKFYDLKGKDFLLLETQNAKAEKVEENVKIEDLKSITVVDATNTIVYKVGQNKYTVTAGVDPVKGNTSDITGFIYDGGQIKVTTKASPGGLAIADTDGALNAADFTKSSLYTISKDATGNVVGLTQQKFLQNAVNGVKVTDKTVGTANSQIKSSTPVFIQNYDVTNANVVSVTSTTFGALDKNISKIDDVTIYGTAKDVSYLVVKGYEISQPSAVTASEMVVNKINYTTDGTKVAYIELLKNGVAQSYELAAGNTVGTGYAVGDIVTAGINDKTGKLQSLTPTPADVTNTIDTNLVSSVNTATGKITLKNNLTYTKATSGIQIYEVVEVNGKDTVVARDFNYLTTLKEDNVLELSYLNGNAAYFDTIVITKNKDVAGPGTPGGPGAGSQYLTVADVTEGATTPLVLNVTGTTFSATADTFVDVSGLPAGYTLGAVTRTNNNQLSIVITGTADFDTDATATVTVYSGGLTGVTTTQTKQVKFVAVDEVFAAGSFTADAATLTATAGTLPTFTAANATITTTPSKVVGATGTDFEFVADKSGLTVGVTTTGVLTFSGTTNDVYLVTVKGTGKFAGKSVVLKVTVSGGAVTGVAIN